MRGKTPLCRNVLLLPLLLFALSPFLSSVAAAPKAMSKPDFSAVTDRIKAGVMVRQGKLVKILLFPAELGGPNNRENVGYVPPEAAEALSLVVGTLRRFTDEGLINTMTVTPEYRGESIIPTRIVMHAKHTAKKGSFDPTVQIW